VNAEGEVMALNGKVSINERAIGRHPDLAEIAVKTANRHSRGAINSTLGEWDGLELHGKIGILGNGIGSMMATLDLVTDAGGKVGSCLNLRHAFLTDVSPTSFCDRLAKGLNILAADKNIQVILLNLLGSVPQTEEISEIIRNFVQTENQELKIPSVRTSSRSRRDSHFPRLVVRIAASELHAAEHFLASVNTASETLIVVENLDEAVTASVRLAKSPTYKKV
jgi:succinyl-CoA synthetase beta subunit